MPIYSSLTPQRAVVTFYAYVDGSAAGSSFSSDGLLVGGGALQIKENSAGDYTLRLPRKFKRVLSVACTPITDVSTCRVVTTSHTDIQDIEIEQVGADQTTPVADGDFYVTVVVSDSDDEYTFDR